MNSGDVRLDPLPRALGLLEIQRDDDVPGSRKRAPLSSAGARRPDRRCGRANSEGRRPRSATRFVVEPDGWNPRIPVVQAVDGEGHVEVQRQVLVQQHPQPGPAALATDSTSTLASRNLLACDVRFHLMITAGSRRLGGRKPRSWQCARQPTADSARLASPTMPPAVGALTARQTVYRRFPGELRWHETRLRQPKPAASQPREPRADGTHRGGLRRDRHRHPPLHAAWKGGGDWPIGSPSWGVAARRRPLQPVAALEIQAVAFRLRAPA